MASRRFMAAEKWFKKSRQTFDDNCRGNVDQFYDAKSHLDGNRSSGDVGWLFSVLQLRVEKRAPFVTGSSVIIKPQKENHRATFVWCSFWSNLQILHFAEAESVLALKCSQCGVCMHFMITSFITATPSTSRFSWPFALRAAIRLCLFVYCYAVPLSALFFLSRWLTVCDVCAFLSAFYHHLSFIPNSLLLLIK